MCRRRHKAALPPRTALPGRPAPQRTRSSSYTCVSTSLRDRKRSRANRRRSGLTLLELMLASLVMVLFAAAISALAMAVQQNTQHNDGVGTVTQHARVSIQRIERAVSGATANEHFPGCIAFGDSINGSTTPDTLVVWRGDVPISDPDGRPLFSELVVYCPDLYQPNRLVEITAPSSRSTTPPISDASGWRIHLYALKVSNWANKTELTDQLHTVAVGYRGESRGMVRFDVTMRPTEKELTAYKSGSLAWEDIKWVQGMHGGQTGLRQTWCRSELQLTIKNGEASADLEIPFVGSACKYFALER